MSELWYLLLVVITALVMRWQFKLYIMAFWHSVFKPLLLIVLGCVKWCAILGGVVIVFITLIATLEWNFSADDNHTKAFENLMFLFPYVGYFWNIFIILFIAFICKIIMDDWISENKP